MKKLGLLSVTGLTMLLGLVNVNTAKKEEAPKVQTLEVKDVLVKGATEGEGRLVRKAAAPATAYGMSDTFLQVTAPDADGTVDVRFVAGIDSYAYTDAKFAVEMFAGAEYKGSIEKVVTTAYAAMEIDGEVKTASEVFGEGYNYLIAYTMKDVPEDSWENGFRATVGLKVEGDEDFTEQEAQEVKVVKSAIMEDNHLLFTWRPWPNQNDNQIDFALQNDLGFNIDEIMSKITATVTLKDGSIYTKAPSGKTTFILFNFPEFNPKTEECNITINLTLDDGTVLTGTRNFTKLPDIKNVQVNQNEDGEYILTFDKDDKVEGGYTYQIISDSYLGKEEKADPNGTKLPTLSLATGTYGIKITAKSRNYAHNTTIVSDIFSVENEGEIPNGTNKFIFELNHKSADYEFVLRFKPVDLSDKITVDNKVTDFNITGTDGNVTYVTRDGYSNGAEAKNNYPYYDSTNEFYIIGFSIGQTPNINKVYGMSFILETDAGMVYSINLSFVAEQTATAIGTSLSVIQEEARLKLEEYYIAQVPVNINKYTNELNNAFKSFPQSDYSEENWVLMNEIYQKGLADIAASTVYTQPESIYKNVLNQLKAVEIAGDKQLNWDKSSATASNEQQPARYAIDGNEGTRWETKSEDPQELIVALESEAMVSRVDIKWEGASAKEYKIHVSTDGVTWTEVYHFTNGSGARTDRCEFTPTAAKYIRIEGISRSTGYGYSIWEMWAFGQVK